MNIIYELKKKRAEIVQGMNNCTNESRCLKKEHNHRFQAGMELLRAFDKLILFYESQEVARFSMTREDYLKRVFEIFKATFPSSFLSINYQFDVTESDDNGCWKLYVKFNEREGLNPSKIIEVFTSFADLDSKLMWHMFRMNNLYQGVGEDADAEFTRR